MYVLVSVCLPKFGAVVRSGTSYVSPELCAIFVV